MSSRLEGLVDIAIETPMRPGVFMIDPTALRMLLLELVRSMNQTGDGSASSLRASVEQLTQEVCALQFQIKELEKEIQQQFEMHEVVNRLERNVIEIRENEQIISDSIDLLATNLQAVQDTLQEQETSDDQNGFPGTAADLVERIEALEKLSPGVLRKSSAKVAQRVSLLGSGGHKRSMGKAVRRFSLMDDIRFNMISFKTSASTMTVDVMPSEPRLDVAAPFEELKRHLEAKGVAHVSAVEEFLTTLKEKPSVTSKMLQELMVLFSGLEADFFAVLARAFNNSSSLNASTLCDILEFILSSPFDPAAAATVVTAVSGDSDGRLLTALSAMLRVLTSAKKISTTVLTVLLETLCQSEGLMEFVDEVAHLSNFSCENFTHIAEEIHFAKDSTIQEFVEIMEVLTSSELNELMNMAITIPGYVNELMFSLPRMPSVSARRLLERLTCLPDNTPQLLVQMVEVMVSSPARKVSLIALACKVLQLTTSIEKDSCEIDNGFYEMFKQLQGSPDVTLESVKEMFRHLKREGGLTLAAVSALVGACRASENHFMEAFLDLLSALAACPAVTGEQVLRVFQLIQKAKFVGARNLTDLLDLMHSAGLFRPSIFDELLAVFRENTLNSGAGLSELLQAISNQDFLTLEDLLRLLREVTATNKRLYEEAQERLAKREAEHKDTVSFHSDEAMTNLGVSREDSQADQGESVAKKVEELRIVQNAILGRLDVLGVPAIRQAEKEPSGTNIHQKDQDKEAPQADEPETASVRDLQNEVKELRTLVTTLMEEKSTKEKKAKTRTALPASDSPRSKSVSPPDATGADKKTPQPPPCSPATPSEAGTRATPQQRSSSLSPSEDGQRMQTSRDGGVSESSQGFYINLSDFETFKKEEANKLDVLLHHFEEHARLCKCRTEWLSDMLSMKAGANDLTEFKAAVKSQLHNFIHKRMPSVPAGVKRRLNVKVDCLSCDTKTMASSEPVPTLPHGGAFPAVFSQRPHTVFELGLIRRHARSLLEGKGERSELCTIPRPCGGQHTSVDVRHTWTYEIHQRETSCERGGGAEGGRCDKGTARRFHGRIKDGGGEKTSMVEELFLPHPPRASNRP